MSVARPGWYLDPRPTEDPARRELRWFDGQAWTSWLAPHGTTRPPVQEPLTRVVPDDVRAQRQRRRLLTAAAWLALFVLVLAVAGVISQRRLPKVTVPTPGPAVTVAPDLQASDIRVDNSSGYGRIGNWASFRIPHGYYAVHAQGDGSLMPDALTTAEVCGSQSGDPTAFGSDATACVMVLNHDMLTPEGYRDIAPSLLRLAAGHVWPQGTVGTIVTSDPRFAHGHLGVQVSAPVVHDGKTSQATLVVGQVTDEQWVAWWDTRPQALPAAQASALEQARAGFGFLR